MSFAANFNQLLFFVGFEGLTFMLARMVLDYTARNDSAYLAPPALILIGVVTGALFVQMKLQDLFIWHLLLFGLVSFAWHRKSNLKDDKLTEIAGKVAAETGKTVEDVKQSYTMTRRLLSFGLISYFVAFSGAVYFLIRT